MRRGRPTTHKKAKWITYHSEDAEEYYELDEKGRIIKERVKIPTNPPTPQFEHLIKPNQPEILVREEKDFIPRVILHFFNMASFQSFPNNFKKSHLGNLNQPKIDLSFPISF
ncbi:hypothetical protein TVAG_376560 [Trichomonas vaginalis G3]|uniref:Uncharacterized protein n=1 Tax=Trichomonas vaginalis (strain ATCC PRA-98 / G3) TaxID=412133 RepID=A2FU83_TRIV3|nr:hypothetical protein TVAGG3_0705910 [Trichomonas vaginalis G3]EAX91544.1 hypothetical protein TVAG_376560 [Trichomonas vaginalis G3]KAI5509569.1 hypothetical protein TVAGG3_0705910 [Trichomonas vaginalis G3]|eukprot:XP_001304474.1 hypothetical protein [Trichomonas vaginalis G3]